MGNDLVTLQLPFPPSVNGLFDGKVRRYPSPAYKRWRGLAGWELEAQRPPRLRHRVDIAIALTPPDKRRRDADNHCKALLDLLVAHRVIDDDADDCVRTVTIGWAAAGSEPGARITITPAGG